MSRDISRRQVLIGGTALAGLAALPAAGGRPAFAAGHSQVAVRYTRDLQNLDPANRVGPEEENLYMACCQFLARLKPGSTEWEPDAASKLTQVSDTEIDFELKPGQMFQQGYGELTAEDVKFSFERFRKPGADGKLPAFADDWIALDHVEVTGQYTGKIILKNPAPTIWLVGICDGSGTLLSKKAFAALGEAKMATTLIGSGPYQIEEWRPNEKVVLTRNPDWKGEKPHFDEFLIRPIQEIKTAELALKAQEINFTEIDAASAKDLAGDPNVEIMRRPGIDYTWLGINMEKPPFTDLKVRQAVRLAIDVDSIIQGAYGGTVDRARALVAPGLLGYWKDAPLYKYDPEAARKLLAEAGQGGGFSTTLTTLTDAGYLAAAQIIQANLAEVGITVKIDALDPGAYWALGADDKAKNVELVIVPYQSKLDSSFQTQWFTSKQIGIWNWQRWNSPEFDKLHDLANSTLDSKKREEAFIRMQQLMDESACFIWITHEVHVYGHSKWLKPVILPNGPNWQFVDFEEA
ncbi:MAG: ABC transporter substrate-binding protein [Dongiaceae bacterium]